MALTGKQRPRASIITPVFNAREFVAGCVANVVAQGDVVLEHIFADGGSTDGTLELIADLQREHPHIRLVPGPDRGQSDAMNKATAVSRGEVIGVLNADDFYEPDAVARGVARLARTRGPTLVCGDCRIIDTDGNTVTWNRPRRLTPAAFLQDDWWFPIPANPSAYFYTRDVHDIVGGYDVDDHLAMDCEFLLTAAERVRMIAVPEHWGNFRLIPGAKTFEDASGPARVTAIIERHKARLSARQRLDMRRLRFQQKLRNRLGRELARFRAR